MSENENLALQLKYLEEKLLKYQKKLEKRIKADDRGNEQTLKNHPSKTVNFKNASPEVIKECEANCDEIKDELEDL